MAHEVETMAFVGSRGLPWHIGETKDRSHELADLVSGDEMLVAAGLDWNVSQRNLFVPGIDGGFVPAPGWVANVRDSDDTTLGIVRPAYRVLQNTALAELGDALVDAGGAHYETGGSLRNGQIVFLSMELPEGISVEGDPSGHQVYLLLKNGHSGMGGGKLDVVVTIVRAVCMNTVSAGITGSMQSFSLTHRSNLDGRIAEARRALTLTFDYAESWAIKASSLVQKTLVERQVEDILTELFPFAEAIKPGKFEQTTFSKVYANWKTSPTIGDDIRYTAWGLYNGVTEYFDHLAKFNGGKRTNSADARAESIIQGEVAKTKERVFARLLKV